MKKNLSIYLFASSILLFFSCNSIGNGNNTSTDVDENNYEYAKKINDELKNGNELNVDKLNKELEVPNTITHGFYYYEGSKLRFFLSDFIKNNPDCFNNEIAMETYSEILKKKLDEAIQKDSTFIMDLVVTYDKIITQEATDKRTGKKAYIVGCKSGPFGKGFDSNDKYDYKVEFCIVGGVSKEEMMKLKEHTIYKIKGVISSRVDDDYEGSKFGITRGKFINLGCFFIKDLGFEVDWSPS